MKYVILAGGSGTRLWPLSRRLFAKQYLTLINERSMLQNTALRVSKDNGKDIYVIAGSDSKFLIVDQLKEAFLKFSKENIIVEPVGRNTAPAIAYGCLFFKQDDIVAVLSSDHFIKDEKKFNEILSGAENIAREGYIVTLGIVPDSPKTGYGYIKRTDIKIQSGYRIEKFVEKPDEKNALEYLKEGSYLWNAGIFIFKVSVLLKELKQHSPDIYEILMKIKAKVAAGKNIGREDFLKFPKISIDYAVMEKSEELVVIPSDIGWNDVGSFKSLYEILGKDEHNNALRLDNKDFININTSDSLFYSEGRKIAAINLKDICVIDTPDALLISDRNSAEDVKKVYEKLIESEAAESEDHIDSKRSWGTVKTLEQDGERSILKVSVRPGAAGEYMNDSGTERNLLLLSGKGAVIRNNKTAQFKSGVAVKIKTGESYRVKNSSKKEMLVFLEIAAGEIYK
jgi:mannose-1-phosphate guanylyltransferase/mannose-6-phosphate isomerase